MRILVLIVFIMGSSQAMHTTNSDPFEQAGRRHVTLEWERDAKNFSEAVNQLEKEHSDILREAKKEKKQYNNRNKDQITKREEKLMALLERSFELSNSMLIIIQNCENQKKHNASADTTFY